MWLLLQSVLLQLQSAYSAGLIPTAEQEMAFQARFFDEDGGSETPRLLTIAGETAEIAINGVLTNRPSFMSSFFGGGNSTYPDIIAALAIAEQDPNVKEIILAIDSPGGEFAGTFETIGAIEAVTKPTKAVLSNVAASAAYGLATAADTIEASNEAVRIGSVGVVVEMHVFAENIKIASTNAPNKAPDVTTEGGVAVVRGELDAMHELFVSSISKGRGVSAADVNANFGQGGTFLSAEALSRGMIDSVSNTALKSTTPSSARSNVSAKSSSQTKLEDTEMNLTQLQAEHPEVFAAAIAAGVAQEHDRVCAHLTMGESSGDMATASAAIVDGSQMTATLQSTYMAAGMKQASIAARTGDNAAAAAGADNEDPAAAAAEADAAAAAEAEAGGNVQAQTATIIAEQFAVEPMA